MRYFLQPDNPKGKKAEAESTPLQNEGKGFRKPKNENKNKKGTINGDEEEEINTKGKAEKEAKRAIDEIFLGGKPNSFEYIQIQNTLILMKINAFMKSVVSTFFIQNYRRTLRIVEFSPVPNQQTPIVAHLVAK